MKYIKTFENIDYDKKLIFLEDAFVEVKEISELFKIEHIFSETNTKRQYQKNDYLSKYNDYFSIQVYLYLPNDIDYKINNKLKEMIERSELRLSIYKKISNTLDIIESDIKDYDIEFSDQITYIKIYN